MSSSWSITKAASADHTVDRIDRSCRQELANRDLVARDGFERLEPFSSSTKFPFVSSKPFRHIRTLDDAMLLADVLLLSSANAAPAAYESMTLVR